MGRAQFSLKSILAGMALAAVALACMRANSERFAVSAALGAMFILQAMQHPDWEWRELPLSCAVWLTVSVALFLVISACRLMLL